MCQAGFEEERELTNHEDMEHTEQIKIPMDSKLEDRQSTSLLGDLVSKSSEEMQAHEQRKSSAKPDP